MGLIDDFHMMYLESILVLQNCLWTAFSLLLLVNITPSSTQYKQRRKHCLKFLAPGANVTWY